MDRLQNGFRVEEIAQAKAHYEQLVAEDKKLHDGPREQEIEVARSQLRVAEAQLTLAHTEPRSGARPGGESVPLRRRNWIRPVNAWKQPPPRLRLREQELDLLLVGTRQEDLERSKAQVEEARQAWELKQNGYRKEDIDAAQAARDAAQFAVDALEQATG